MNVVVAATPTELGGARCADYVIRIPNKEHTPTLQSQRPVRQTSGNGLHWRSGPEDSFLGPSHLFGIDRMASALADLREKSSSSKKASPSIKEL